MCVKRQVPNFLENARRTTFLKHEHGSGAAHEIWWASVPGITLNNMAGRKTSPFDEKSLLR
ncbi:hypothetical protein OnM2_060028 [Erysiphe neolycopersici]|uniref:Uncharacterized protein n=1 Tax=Erysiphe neolycopersici TaxID=212602 RepID=A0A420HPK7_9PEZI|nr:hypothetical protein OnM2_060028 [Erysiphe neolycopersici]